MNRKSATPAKKLTATLGKGKRKRSAAHTPTETPIRIAAAKPSAPSLELYQKEACPFSHAVRRKLSDLGLDYVCHNVADGSALKHEQLVRAGGKDQIPFFVDHRTGVKLYESGSIVAYLETEYGKVAESRVLRYARGVANRLRSNADVLAWQLRQPLDRWSELRRDLEETGLDVLDSLKTLRASLKESGQEGSRPKSI